VDGEVFGSLCCRSRSLDAFQLSALERAVMTTKSVLLSARLLLEYLNPEKCQGHYGVEGIAQLASLEVRFQTQLWGEVEDSICPSLNKLIQAHDVHYADIRRQLGSAAALLHT